MVSSDSLDQIYAAQRANAGSVGATDASARIEKIRRMEKMLFAHRADIRKAMADDFRKPAAETDLSDIFPIVGEARHAARHLRRWMKPQRVATPLALLGSSSRLIHEPKGVVLILSPWNFPFNLTLGPLVSAIAAGNCAMLKPSEMTPASSACMKRIVSELFDENEVAVIEGGPETAEALLKKRFDHIFFTGSPAVGRIVMRAAAEHLTSVTLELGGKSPVIVDRTADLDEAASRIAWGKFLNAGQVCIAPDYLLVDETIRAPFLEKLVAAVRAMEGEGSRGIIVNERHAARVRRLLDSAQDGEILLGGSSSDARSLPPTIVSNVAPDSALMQEEIFGPILPVVTYRTLDEALAIIAAKEKPLVLYIFSRAHDVVRDIINRTRAGGTVVNHTLIHFYQLNLPFGGSGESGMGKGHGRAGFEAFSNARGIVEQRTRFSPIQLMFPPYTRFKQKLIDLTLRFF
ncbi:MAG: aldehyde dehydrogenase family protein [Thermoanaerobaculia bacterium]|nr:aldehyde dehydrogenase family protein [Thermoanaerobaculia bacterium]